MRRVREFDLVQQLGLQVDHKSFLAGALRPLAGRRAGAAHFRGQVGLAQFFPPFGYVTFSLVYSPPYSYVAMLLGHEALECHYNFRAAHKRQPSQ